MEGAVSDFLLKRNNAGEEEVSAFVLNWAKVFLLSQILRCPLRSLHCSLTLEPLPEKILLQKVYWSGAFLGLGQIPSKNVVQPYTVQ